MNRSPFRFDILVSVASLVSLIIVLLVICTASLTRHVVLGGEKLPNAVSSIVLSIAEFPSILKRSIKELIYAASSDPEPLLLDRKSIEKSHWIRKFPSSEDSGFLLLSGVDPEKRHSNVRLIRISTGEVVFRWDPDWEDIIRRTSSKRFVDELTYERMRAFHPLLMDDGSIIFNTEGSLVSLSPCITKPKWINDSIFHHSIERANDGAIWAASVNLNGFSPNSWLNQNMRDDAIAKVNSEGKVLEVRSLTRILIDNKLDSLVFGLAGKQFRTDPIHLNQISEAEMDSRFWRKGDLLLSARHMSTVFLYRPSTNEIIWHSTGPWKFQHAAQFIDEHRIAVFDNNVFGGALEDNWFVEPSDTNRIVVFNFDTRVFEQPFVNLFSLHKPITPSQGRMRFLPDGGLFLEETDFGRHLRFTAKELLWSRVNDYDSERIGIVAWSRYLLANEIEKPLSVLQAQSCFLPKSVQ